MAYIPCTEIPKDGNPYYNTKDNGGYSTAIKGKPTCKGLNVLSNCVGWAFGRFNEIAGKSSMPYLAPVNAENFWDYAGGLKKGQTPKLGAVMVWQKGATRTGKDGAGHVCIVEKIISETEVVTSESGWNNPTHWYSKTRKKGSNGRWGQDSNYTFLGFIYNPAVSDDDQPVDFNARIRDFQSWMNKTYGYNLVIDGRAGKQTLTTSVKCLQTELNKRGAKLVIDGGYGKLTKAAMKTLKKGDKSNLVYILQGLLYANGFNPKGFDGSYGNGCEQAVKDFQAKKKIWVDGKAGPDTFAKLLGK